MRISSTPDDVVADATNVVDDRPALDDDDDDEVRLSIAPSVVDTIALLLLVSVLPVCVERADDDDVPAAVGVPLAPIVALAALVNVVVVGNGVGAGVGNGVGTGVGIGVGIGVGDAVGHMPLTSNEVESQATALL